MDKTIIYVFQKKDLDVESHVMPTVNEDVLRRKEHQKGIHRRPKVDVNPENDDDLLSESSHDSLYNVASQGSMPRRSLGSSPLRTVARDSNDVPESVGDYGAEFDEG